MLQETWFSRQMCLKYFIQCHSPFRVSCDFSKGRATPARLELADAMSSPWNCEGSRVRVENVRQWLRRRLKNSTQWTGQMAQRLGTFVALAEDPGSIPRVYMVIHNHV